MKYKHGDKVYVDLDLSHGWADKKLALNNTYVTIDRFAGYWDNKNGLYYESPSDVPRATEVTDTYYIIEDCHLFFWPEDDFWLEECAKEEVVDLLE